MMPKSSPKPRLIKHQAMVMKKGSISLKMKRQRKVQQRSRKSKEISAALYARDRVHTLQKLLNLIRIGT